MSVGRSSKRLGGRLGIDQLLEASTQQSLAGGLGDRNWAVLPSLILALPEGVTRGKEQTVITLGLVSRHGAGGKSIEEKIRPLPHDLVRRLCDSILQLRIVCVGDPDRTCPPVCLPLAYPRI